MIHQSDVTYPGPGGRSVRGHLARPEPSGTPLPGVLVLHEIFGLNDDMRRIAARFASEGYVALAPDFFDLKGPKPLCVLAAIRSLRREGGAVFDLLAAAQAWLAQQPDVAGDRIGAVGFCMGGGFAALHAAKAPLAVVGIYYGNVPKDAASLRGICPVVGGYGARDRVFGPAAQRLRGHLDALGVQHDIRTYPDCGHSYMSPDKGILSRLAALGPMHVGYDEAAANDSWSRMLSFFGEHL